MPRGIETSKLWNVVDLLYKPDIQIELRPDAKRIVIRQGGGGDIAEVWIDCRDVDLVTEAMKAAVAEARLNHVIEDFDD